jgi:hypothetical protein
MILTPGVARKSSPQQAFSATSQLLTAALKKKKITLPRRARVLW